MQKLHHWIRFIPGCVIGNLLELYDFILYAYFSTIIGLLFFPTTDQFTAKLLAFSVFATGCLMRPVGALIFGWVGDRLGRKKALTLSVGLITFSTCLIGLLPTYSQIGIMAPVILLISRLLQGMAMCGEEVGGAIYLIESAPKQHRCFAGSIILGSVYIGLMLASMVAFATVTLISHDTLVAWGWRIPFLLSLPFGITALYIRLNQPDTKPFSHIKIHNQLIKKPVRYTIKHYYPSLLRCVLLAALMAVVVYLFAVYMPSYISTHFQFGLSGTMLINIICFLMTTVIALLTGWLSDKFGSERMLKIAAISTMVLIYPIFHLLDTHTVLNALMCELLLAVIVGLSAGSLMQLLIFPFPTPLRFTGASISFNFSMTLFGSSAPIILLFLFHQSDSRVLPALYVITIAMISCLASLSVQSPDLEEDYVDQTNNVYGRT